MPTEADWGTVYKNPADGWGEQLVKFEHCTIILEHSLNIPIYESDMSLLYDFVI